MMGKRKEQLDFQQCISAVDVIFVPTGTWHNVVNKGRCPLKLYSIYTPPHHLHGTVHRTKADADRLGDLSHNTCAKNKSRVRFHAALIFITLGLFVGFAFLLVSLTHTRTQQPPQYRQPLITEKQTAAPASTRR